jgi:hypothetical protein
MPMWKNQLTKNISVRQTGNESDGIGEGFELDAVKAVAMGEYQLL